MVAYVTPFLNCDKNNSISKIQRLNVRSSLHASLPLVLSHGLSCILHGLLIKRIQAYFNAFRSLSVRCGQRCSILRKGHVCSMALFSSHAPRIARRSLCRAAGPYRHETDARHVDVCINRMIASIEWPLHVSRDSMGERRSGGRTMHRYTPRNSLLASTDSRVFTFQQSSKDGPALQWTCAG